MHTRKSLFPASKADDFRIIAFFVEVLAINDGGV
jgi:hypothetical protein